MTYRRPRTRWERMEIPFWLVVCSVWIGWLMLTAHYPTFP